MAAEPQVSSRNTESDSSRHYADRTPDPAFLEFLDTEDFELRMECLKALEERITQQELDSMYLVLDMKPELFAGTALRSAPLPYHAETL